MKKISFYLRNYSSYALIILVSCFIPNQSVASETNITEMTGIGERIIVFQSERNGSIEEIYIMYADGSMQTRLTFNNSRDVWLMDFDGSNEIQLTQNPAINEDACWTPNGTKIVFQSDRNGFYQLFTMNPDGSDQIVTPNSQSDCWPSWGIDSSQTGVNENQKSWFGLQLYQNYPNPFNPTTTVAYQIPEKSFVSLRVFDVLGELVRVLVNEEKPAGEYTVKFDGTGLSSGINVYKMQVENSLLGFRDSHIQSKKMLLMK